jgi:hypothetical protein
MNEPKAAIEAVLSPAPLTIGKFALLVKHKCPILDGNLEDIESNILALYIFSRPIGEVIDVAENLSRLSLEWAESLSPLDYRKKISELLDALAAFYEMLPRPEDGSKKN